MPKKPDQPKCTCPLCSCGMQFPQVLRVLITCEEQMWRVGKNGNYYVPVFVEDKPKK